MAELGIAVSPLGIAQYYTDSLNGIILDVVDRELCPAIESLGLLAAARQTLMKTKEDKKGLAEELLTWTENMTS
jgi:hypothetical protein